MAMVRNSLRRRPSYTNQKTIRPRFNPIPRGGQDLSGTYYHVHNYIQFKNIINKALEVALRHLKNGCRRTTNVHL
ncbi:MAG: hypothetical protein ACKPKO_06720 [Candidatus Fonsibacter sp.]